MGLVLTPPLQGRGQEWGSGDGGSMPPAALPLGSGPHPNPSPKGEGLS